MMREGILGVSVAVLAVCSIGLFVAVPAGLSALLHGHMRRLLYTAATAAVLFAIALIAALTLGAQPFLAGTLN